MKACYINTEFRYFLMPSHFHIQPICLSVIGQTCLGSQSRFSQSVSGLGAVCVFYRSRSIKFSLSSFSVCLKFRFCAIYDPSPWLHTTVPFTFKQLKPNKRVNSLFVICSSQFSRSHRSVNLMSQCLTSFYALKEST